MRSYFSQICRIRATFSRVVAESGFKFMADRSSYLYVAVASGITWGMSEASRQSPPPYYCPMGIGEREVSDMPVFAVTKNGSIQYDTVTGLLEIYNFKDDAPKGSEAVEVVHHGVLAKLESRVKELESEREWTEVESGGMPDEEGWYLCAFSDGSVETFVIDDLMITEGGWRSMYSNRRFLLTHWTACPAHPTRA